jgi:3,4-dihydroxy-9,10-secoandrosta-1,3,5(10)-triene-9,17-dione 4,5-dioxygenase
MATAGDILGLGYFAVQAQDLAGWRDFATTVLGAAIVPDTGPDRVRLRVDEHAWRVEIAEAPLNAFGFVGWQVADETALERLIRRIEEAGIRTSKVALDGLRDRGVVHAVQFTEPSGIRVELFVAPSVPSEHFVSPTGTRFVTGSMGLGHLVFRVARYQESVDFYRQAMGFGVSDVLTLGGTHLTFLHCNQRHHSLALASSVSGSQLLHFMIEVDSLDDVGYALDRCERYGVELVKTIGRHSNDRMVSFYARTPGGFEVEYGWGARVIDPSSWAVAQIESPSIWGHRLLVEHR